MMLCRVGKGREGKPARSFSSSSSLITITPTIHCLIVVFPPLIRLSIDFILIHQKTTETDLWEDDRAVVSWFEVPANKKALSAYVASKRAEIIAMRMKEHLTELASIASSADAVKVAVSSLSASDKAALLKALQDTD